MQKFYNFATQILWYLNKQIMNITKTQVDDLNAIVTVAITKEDYSDKVEKVLADYRKNASVPGFR